MTMKIMPKTMTGQLHSLNKGCCDWGWQRLLAYGCQSCVVIVDPATVQTIQVLDHHRSHVVKVKWARENYHHDLSSPYTLRLAAADSSGKIVIWDVSRAVIGAECTEGSRPVADMDWVGAQDASHDLLAALHPPSTLILWNTENGSRLWKKTYSDVLLSFAFDPFDPSRLAFLGQDCILFVDDFSLSGAPMSSGKKFHISSPSSGSMANSASTDRMSDKRSSTIATTSTRSTIRKVSSILVGGDGPWKPSDDDSGASSSGIRECLQLVYHKACRQHLILVYAREILILDLDIGQTVCVVPTERTGSPFAFVMPLRECDALLCVHESGGISLRMRRRGDTSHASVSSSPISEDESASNVGIDVIYDNCSQSDSLRITKHNRVSAAAVCPVTERQASLITSDGRVLMWEINIVFGSQFPQLCNLASDVAVQSSVLSLADLTGVVDNNRVTSVNDRHNSVIKLMMTGFLNGVSSSPAVLRMCPPLTTKNFSVYRPLLAVGGGGGGSVGTVQIYDLSGGFLWREFAVHTCAVRGIEWVSRRGFLSFAYPTTTSSGNNSGGGGLVRNEIMLTDIDTGRSVPLRTNVDDESPIEGLRSSYLKQYFAILFRDRPFELWDLRTLTLLRRMPKTFPLVTALEWSPSHGGGSKVAKKKPSTPETNGGGDTPLSVTTSSSMLDLATTPSGQTPSSEFGEDKSSTLSPAVREHFVFTDINGLLYHFIIEGNLVRDGSKIPPDSGMGSITCIAWKAETLVLSDVDGNLNLWDLRGKVSRAVVTSRGWIRKIRFAPGRGNMKLAVLYYDGNGIDIWDAKDVDRIASLRCPKDLAKVIDVEWAASDRPVLVCADGCIRVMDITCTTSSSAIEDYQLMEPIFCAHSLSSRAGLILHSVLQHRSGQWGTDFSNSQGSLDASNSIPVSVTDHLGLLDSRLCKYMETCSFGTAERCLITARLFGDESELVFWTVAQHYIRASAAGGIGKTPSGDGLTILGRGAENLLILDEGSTETTNDDQSLLPTIRNKLLGTCHDIVRDNRTFGEYERRRAALHDARRAPGEPTRRCAEDLILLGDADRAVQLLLETDPTDADKFYVDSLRACLVASVRSSGASQSTIKLVATNLIACGRLSEGVQLLCLIDKGADACRYLQTYGQWREAARLAKATLGETECADVMRRWADHLASPAVDRRSSATLVLLSLGRFTAVVDLLVSVRHFDRAALFIEACQEFGLLQECPSAEVVFSGYARFLYGLGLNRLFEYYCNKAGEKGKVLLAELQQN